MRAPHEHTQFLQYELGLWECVEVQNHSRRVTLLEFQFRVSDCGFIS